MKHLTTEARAELFALIAERATASPTECMLSWEYLAEVADSAKVEITRRKYNPNALQPEQYVRLTDVHSATTAAYLIYGGARVEVAMTHERAADYRDHPAVTFPATTPPRVHVYLDKGEQAHAAAIELTRRALADAAARTGR